MVRYGTMLKPRVICGVSMDRKGISTESLRTINGRSDPNVEFKIEIKIPGI
jgi:hypothetical protein